MIDVIKTMMETALNHNKESTNLNKKKKQTYFTTELIYETNSNLVSI